MIATAMAIMAKTNAAARQMTTRRFTYVLASQKWNVQTSGNVQGMGLRV
ncbi:MAG: hypothetical protein WB681_10870 [Candidatus Cybelea sp.]